MDYSPKSKSLPRRFSDEQWKVQDLFDMSSESKRIESSKRDEYFISIKSLHDSRPVLYFSSSETDSKNHSKSKTYPEAPTDLTFQFPWILDNELNLLPPSQYDEILERLRCCRKSGAQLKRSFSLDRSANLSESSSSGDKSNSTIKSGANLKRSVRTKTRRRQDVKAKSPAPQRFSSLISHDNIVSVIVEKSGLPKEVLGKPSTENSKTKLNESTSPESPHIKPRIFQSLLKFLNISTDKNPRNSFKSSYNDKNTLKEVLRLSKQKIYRPRPLRQQVLISNLLHQLKARLHLKNHAEITYPRLGNLPSKGSRNLKVHLKLKKKLQKRNFTGSNYVKYSEDDDDFVLERRRKSQEDEDDEVPLGLIINGEKEILL